MVWKPEVQNQVADRAMLSMKGLGENLPSSNFWWPQVFVAYRGIILNSAFT
jgi:hypothetical protein